MATTTDERERLSAAVREAMRAAIGRRSAVPVREIAHAIIAETHSDPERFDEVLDALCALCIRNGLPIEFTRQPVQQAI